MYLGLRRVAHGVLSVVSRELVGCRFRSFCAAQVKFVDGAMESMNLKREFYFRAKPPVIVCGDGYMIVADVAIWWS